MTKDIVHYSDWAGQPNIRIACTQNYTQPAWGQSDTKIEGVYASENEGLYTFDICNVTCPKCLEIIKEQT